MSQAGRFVIGVDVGGTYTDLFILDETSGRCAIGKVASRRGSEALGILDALERSDVPLAAAATIVHGTTVGTNALLERKGARTALITTKGFRDVLEMRRRDRPRTWGLWGQFEPVVPRDRRFEIAERIRADGAVVEEPDLAALPSLVARMRGEGIEAVALCFINAYANPRNEQQVAASLRRWWPEQDHLTISSDILPELREFERTSTTVLNAYLQPVVGRYLKRLDESLRERRFAGEFLIVQSNGGVMALDEARIRPIRTALSGPAAGVIAAAHIAKLAGFDNVVTGDVGGTSFDVSLIANGETSLSAQSAIDFGMVIRSPMIEIRTIGAGGGSIAFIDRGGLLQVGPESAGSVPGPACYGQGNDRPTVTDANVVLNRIDAARPIGNLARALDVDRAREAIRRHVGAKLDLGDEKAAEAIIAVANSRMAGAIRLVSIERGHDPRRFALLPFGGGGALHAGALIKEVGLAGALVPRYPGVTSALGCIIADMRHDFVRTLNRLVARVDFAALHAMIAALVGDGHARLDACGVRFIGRGEIVSLDMSFVGQTHTIVVPLPWAKDRPIDRAAIEARFLEEYAKLYGNLPATREMRIVNLNVAVIGRREKIDLAILAPAADATIEGARIGARRVFVDGDWVEAAIHRRLDLPVGARIAGPAILEQPDTTIWLEPDLEGRVDRYGNFIIQRRGEGG
jgi:N-methylhydantoinase A